MRMWQLGSSTSQSNNCALEPSIAARLVAMVVLPVPPFPLATLMIMCFTNELLHSADRQTSLRSD